MALHGFISQWALDLIFDENKLSNDVEGAILASMYVVFIEVFIHIFLLLIYHNQSYYYLHMIYTALI